MAFYLILNNCGGHFCGMSMIVVGKGLLFCFAHTHMHFHDINSMPEFRPFRRKCWLRSREIIISAMASQTLPEFMILITSWGNNLRTVIRKDRKSVV